MNDPDRVCTNPGDKRPDEVATKLTVVALVATVVLATSWILVFFQDGVRSTGPTTSEYSGGASGATLPPARLLPCPLPV